MRFCQTDGNPLMDDGGDAVLGQRPTEDLLDVPSEYDVSLKEHEEPLMDIPAIDADVPRPPDFIPPRTAATPPPSPFNESPAESEYARAQAEEIRSTFGQENADWTPAPPPIAAAPISSWQSDEGVASPSFQSAAALGNKEQTLAIISLVLGIAGLTVCCGAVIPSVAAIITGVMARGKAKNNPNQYGGDGMALAGIITGIVGILGGLIVLAFWMFGMFASVATGSF